MRRISKEEINVVGDTLEACLYSRFLLSTNKNITKINHYVTDNLGGIYYDREKNNHYNILFLNSKAREKISEFLPDCKFELIIDNYLKIPFKKIRFSNSQDGFIRFPITMKSFELEIDYQDAVCNPLSFEQFIKEYKEAKNITKVMKMIFSEQFFLDVIKNIGVNQWNIKLSQVDPIKLYKNILNLEYIDIDDVVEYYHPIDGATKLCEELLSHPNINVIRTNRKSIKDVVNNDRHRLTYIQDYVDYYMNFMFGSLDYIQYQTEVHKKSISYSQIKRVFSPYDKKYFQFFEKDSITYKTWSKDMKINSNDFDFLALVPSMNNYKKIQEYKKVAAVSQTIKIIG